VSKPAKESLRKRGRLEKSRKKKIAEAEAIIAKEQLKKAEEAARRAETPAVEVEAPAAEVKTPAADPQTLTTTQWLSVISIIISLVGIYYKREEIKKVFAQKSPPKVSTPPPVDFSPPPVKTPRKGGIQLMD